jgi:hypothetical protein
MIYVMNSDDPTRSLRHVDDRVVFEDVADLVPRRSRIAYESEDWRTTGPVALEMWRAGMGNCQRISTESAAESYTAQCLNLPSDADWSPDGLRPAFEMAMLASRARGSSC